MGPPGAPKWGTPVGVGHSGISKSGANIAQRLAPSACATVAATMDPLDLGRSGSGEPATELKALRQLADQAFARAAGAPLVAGNSVRILKDAGENYPAWREAICAAQRNILFESYIIGNAAIGREVGALLPERARAA